MAKKPFTGPLEDSVAKIDGEVAVGEDLVFQRRWWKFEGTIWIFFGLILFLTLAGAFGRGPLAKAHRRSADGAMDLRYDRIGRTGTPSDLTIQFGPSAIQEGEITLFASEGLVSKLGAQRISPEPARTIVGDGGLTYVFPATQQPATVIFSLQPSGPGVFPFELRLPKTGSSASVKVFVVP